MPIIILVVAVIAFMAAINGTVQNLGKQVSSDLFGDGHECGRPKAALT